MFSNLLTFKFLHRIKFSIFTDNLVVTKIITHTFPLGETYEAYKVFDQKKENNIKVVFKPK